MKRDKNKGPRHNGEPVVVPVSAEDTAAIAGPYDRCRGIEAELGGILLSILREPRVRSLEAEHAGAWVAYRKAMDATTAKYGVAGKPMVFDMVQRQFRRAPQAAVPAAPTPPAAEAAKP